MIVGQFHTLVFSVQCPFPIDLRTFRFDIVRFFTDSLKGRLPRKGVDQISKEA